MNSKNGFTLVELLVVIAVIGILIALLVPAVQMVREVARRTSCSNNMRQIGISLMSYEASYKRLPDGWKSNDASISLTSPGWGWSSSVLPFVEGQNVHSKIDFNLPIDHAFNLEIIKTPIPTFLCPSEPASEVVDLGTHNHGGFLVGRSNYSGVFGSTEVEDGPAEGNGAFFANSRLRLTEFQDGLSNTMLVGERRNDFGTISWVGAVSNIEDPFLRIVGVADHGPNDRGGNFEDFRSYHPSGINVVMADGSVHFLSNSIDEVTFQAVATRAGGEVVSMFDN